MTKKELKLKKLKVDKVKSAYTKMELLYPLSGDDKKH